MTLLVGVVVLSRPPAIFPTPPNARPANNASAANLTDPDLPDNDNPDHQGHHHHPHHHHHPSDAYKGEYSLIGISAAFAVPVLSAWIVIITRQAKHVHYSVLVFWFAIGGQIVSIVGIYCFEDDPTLFKGWEVREWILSFLVAFVGILGSILMTKAVCWVTPSKVMVVRSFEVLCAYVLQVTVFESPTYLTDMFGTILIITAVLLMGAEDTLMARLSWRFL